jgi:hypothetical protein
MVLVEPLDAAEWTAPESVAFYFSAPSDSLARVELTNQRQME